LRIAVNLTAVRSVGTRTHAAGLFPALARRAPEHSFALFTTPELAGLLRDRLSENVECRVVPRASTLYGRLVWEQTLLPARLRGMRADVLYAPMEFAPLLARCPMLLAIHNAAPYVNGGAANLARRLLSRRSCRKADAVVFVSHQAAEALGARLGVPAAKRRVIHHGTDPQRWARPAAAEPLRRRYGLEDAPYLLFVSQLYRQKDPGTLIEAFALWRRNGGRHLLLLTGTAVENGFLAELRGLAARLGVAEQVRFLGLVPAEDLPALYQHADAFVLPTRLETFGQPFIEAMASGTPVVCADTAVAREVCGECALYFPAGDAAGLRDRLVALAGDPALRARLTERGRARAALFSLDREADGTLLALGEVARSRRG
jgi:glycosyltransferase involved in cell wall biosynthesis